MLAKVEREERKRAADGAYVPSRDTGFRAYLNEIGLNKNRAHECERIAAIPEPKLRNGPAPGGGFADRNERRNITVGQKAMGYAMLFPNPERGGRGKKLSPKSKSIGAESEGYAQKLISQARTILRETPELAIKVRDGFPLNVRLAREQPAAPMSRGQGAHHDER